MVYVTRRAKEELKRLLAAEKEGPGVSLRIMDRGRGKLGLGTGTAAPGDEVVEDEGRALLVVGPRLAAKVRQISLDAYDTPDGPELVITEEVVRQSSVTCSVNWVALPRADYSRN
ncbi:MAG: hypothetical protein ABID71_04890 [Chloroflexota bacterium]